MNDNDKEALSALMDNECDAFSLRRLLSSTEANAISETWSRYHAVQNVIHRNGSEQFLNIDISKRVAAELNEDITARQSVDEMNTNKNKKVVDYFTESKKPASNVNAGKQNWIRGMVAASVAVAVVIGTGGLGGFSINKPQVSVTGDVASTQAIAPVISPLSQLATSTQGSIGLQTVSATIGSNNSINLTPSIDRAALDGRYNRYLLQHVEQTSLNGRQGMMNFARMGDYQDF